MIITVSDTISKKIKTIHIRGKISLILKENITVKIDNIYNERAILSNTKL